MNYQTRLIIQEKGAPMEEMTNEEMTNEEMQRFLDLQSIEGKTKIEAFDNLMMVLGITFKENKND